ncbi:hypothetical protein [Aerolutibacter ruishenii]|uniref:hypothetical protein n=1 Tax=Aerolutibacter ruishenii TaxID=686800 RepID=UPI0011A53246|nr:hypothetical protein [Lysobacter ruishenii]
MKDHNGQSSFTAEITLDEANGRVSMGALKLPAVFSSAEVTWNIDTPSGPPGGFEQRLNRYSGEFVVSFVNPTTGHRLVPHSGVCQPAAESKRRF